MIPPECAYHKTVPLKLCVVKKRVLKHTPLFMCCFSDMILPLQPDRRTNVRTKRTALCELIYLILINLSVNVICSNPVLFKAALPCLLKAHCARQSFLLEHNLNLVDDASEYFYEKMQVVGSSIATSDGDILAGLLMV